ncbi:MAG: radical SAM protein [Candidatus Cloacimonetes bacterium]|nr:radical SAM protein [Candidatus Cloacimonadota bacterium]
MKEKIYPDKQKLYKLPWSTNESPIGWLEVTDICNIHCEGCYRLNRDGHKPFEQLKEEILLLKKWRNCDSITLAGGESLLHPNILDLVKFINNKGMKSVIITNGVALNMEILQKLKKAGLSGVNFHIDSTQNRPEFKGIKDVGEADVNTVRVKYARMVKKVKGLTTGFGITVDTNNLTDIPKFVQWGIENIHVVNSLSFKTFRGLLVEQGFEYFAGSKKIELKKDSLGYTIGPEKKDRITITSSDVYSTIKQNFPEYEANSYLSGTRDYKSLKWILGNVILNTKHKLFGALGKRSMEIIQTGYHFLFGTYPIHTKRRFGRSLFWLALFDKTVRKAFCNWLKYILVFPIRVFYPIKTLNIGIVQPPDLLPDGSCDMCEGCPDLCVFEGKLVNSCRLDEYIKYGCVLHVHSDTNS